MKQSIMFDTQIFTHILISIDDQFARSRNSGTYVRDIDMKRIKTNFNVYISQWQKEELSRVYGETKKKIDEIYSYLAPDCLADVNLLPFFLPCVFLSNEQLNIYDSILSNLNQIKTKENNHIDARIATISIGHGITLVTNDTNLRNIANRNFKEYKDLFTNDIKAISLPELMKLCN